LPHSQVIFGPRRRGSRSTGGIPGAGALRPALAAVAPGEPLEAGPELSAGMRRGRRRYLLVPGRQIPRAMRTRARAGGAPGGKRPVAERVSPRM